MKPHTFIVLLIQCMQLPVIALIIAVSISYRKSRDIEDRDWGTLHIFKSNPLGFMSAALSFNFLSILFAITQTLTDSAGKNEFYRIALFLDIATAICFLVEVIPFVILHYGKSFFPNSPAIIKNLIRKKYIYIALAFISTLVIIYNWNRHRLTYYLFDCIIYSFVGYYSFWKLKVNDISKPGNANSNKYVCIGFLIWAAVQLVPISKYFGAPVEYIEIIGYTGSAIGKVLILFGLYNFTILVVRSFAEKQAVHNRKLEALPRIINEVSNCSDITVLGEKICEHLTGCENVFNFEYAVISFVDYLKGKIFNLSSLTVNTKITNPEEWIRMSGIPLSHHDIVAIVAREKRSIPIEGYYVDGVRINLEDPLRILNSEVFTEYNHQDLNRVLLPIKDSKTLEEEKSTIAVLEMGYHISTLQPPNLRIIQGNEFKLYLDNCSQTFNKLVEAKTTKDIENILHSADSKSRDNHILFLEEILDSVCILLNTGIALMVTIPVNLPVNNATVIFSKTIKGTGKSQNNVEAILRRYLKSKNSENDYFEKGLLLKDLSRYFKCENFLYKTFNLNESTAGVLLIGREHISLDNDLIANMTQTVLSGIPPLYNEKLFHNSAASLITPDDIMSDVEINLQPVMDAIQKYFKTYYSVLFLKDATGGYQFAYASTMHKSSIQKLRDFTVDTTQDYYFLDLSEKSNTVHKYFSSLGKKFHTGVALIKPLVTQHKEYGFVAVFYKTKPSLLYEDVSFLNLVSVKALASLQLQSLIAAFRDISDTFAQNNLKTTLGTITNHAMELLNADPVILFKTNNGKDVYFKDGTYSYKENFKNERILKLFQSQEEQPVELAEIIVRSGTRYFENYTEYLDFMSRNTKKHLAKNFNEDFWSREKIKSMAAIRLTNKIGSTVKVVGVLFINFRTEIKYNADIKRLIETFASFAAGSIANGVILEKNRLFIRNNLKLSRPIMQEQLIAYNLHNAKKIFSALDTSLENMKDVAYNNFESSEKKINTFKERIDKMQKINEDLQKKFDEIDMIYMPDDKYTFREINIIELIMTQLGTLEAELLKKNITQDHDFYAQNVPIYCDDITIGVAILNILNNAYQAMEPRGKLEIRVKEYKSNKIKIDIIDNGKGISDEILPNIFEPYATDKVDGSGLGLPMSKFFIENVHSGMLKGESKNGFTTFTIILPKYNGELTENQK